MQTIIFLNGKIPKLELINKFIRKKSFIIAADGAANFLKKVNIVPNLIIGDLDSISHNTLQFFKNKKVEIIKILDQNYTDFEKSLTFCLKKKLYDIIIFGAISLRADHTLNNFSVLKRYHERLKMKFISDEFEIFYIDKKTNFKYKLNEVVSLLAIPKANKIKTSGLEFPLFNEDLEFGVREGTLNKSISDHISITLRNGSLLIFKRHFIITSR